MHWTLLIVATFSLLVSAKNPRIELEPWELTDWDPLTENFPPHVPVGRKDYLYRSALPEGTLIFKPFGTPWHIPNAQTDWGTIQNPNFGTSVPGPFPYTETWSEWNNPAKKDSFAREAVIISAFGHEHIIIVVADMLTKMANPNFDRTLTTKMLQKLAGAPAVIFAWFGGLVNAQAQLNPTYPVCQYNPAPPQCNNCFMDAFTQIMKQFIFGQSAPYDSNTSTIYLEQVHGFMTLAIQIFGVNPTHIADLENIRDRVIAAVRGMTRNGTVPIKAWDPLMRAHQQHTNGGYDFWVDYFAQNNNNAAERDAAANAVYRLGVDMGAQMAAFFTLFDGFSDFTDKLILENTTMNPTNYYVKPYELGADNFFDVAVKQERYWREHTILFEDINKAAARGDQEVMYEVLNYMLDSCSFIATTVGQVIFNDFHDLMRRRQIIPYLVAKSDAYPNQAFICNALGYPAP